MRIAWVTPYLPEPATSGGPIRQQRLARALREWAELDLFARGEPWEAPRAKSAELECFERRWVGRDYLPPALGRAQAHALDAPRPVRRGSPRALWRALRRAHARTAYSGVVVSHCWAALGVHELGLPWVLDEHNVESQYFGALFRAQGRTEAGFQGELARLERWERRVWQDALSLSCVSDADALRIAPHRATRPTCSAFESAPLVVENGADLERLPFVPPESRRGGVLFVGALHHRPNLDAALRLVTAVLPRVWRSTPEVPLSIVGGPVPSVLERAARAATGRVLLRGRVPDVGAELAAARVFVNPLQHGAGSSLKVIEALASGIPLVSTELGARGFGLAPGEHYARAESDAELACAVLEALTPSEVTCRRAARGRAQAEHFAWPALAARFVARVVSTFSRCRPAR